MIFVIDASVAVKWFVDERSREKARELLRNSIVRSAPDIVFSEVANALRKKIVAREISFEQASFALDELPSCLPNIVPTPSILHDAFSLSVQLGHPVADCLYLACAQYVGGHLVSDDEKFVRKCQEHLSSSVVRLMEWTMPPTHQSTRSPFIDEAIEAKLIQLSAIYQQTKSGRGRHWLGSDVTILTEPALKDAILNLDANQRAHLMGTG